MKRTGAQRHLYNVTLYELEGGLWEDSNGTLYGLTDPRLGVDSNNRAGVGILTLPRSHFLSQAAPMHDAMFTNPTFQKFHTLSEANEWYLRNAEILGRGSFGAKVWLTVARFALDRFSKYFWDNPSTER